MTKGEAEAWRAETVAFYADSLAECEVARRKAERERDWLVSRLAQFDLGRSIVNQMRRVAA